MGREGVGLVLFVPPGGSGVPGLLRKVADVGGDLRTLGLNQSFTHLLPFVRGLLDKGEQPAPLYLRLLFEGKVGGDVGGGGPVEQRGGKAMVAKIDEKIVMGEMDLSRRLL